MNDTFTRSFDFNDPVFVNPTYGFAYADGMEISGKVILSYKVVPEPSIMVLLAGLLGLVLALRRKRA